MRWLQYTGSFEYDPGVDTQALLNHLVAELDRKRAAGIVVAGNTISFRGGPFPFRWVDNWNLFVPFDKCGIVVDHQQREVRYQLSIRYFVLYTALVFGTMGVSIWREGPALLAVILLLVLIATGGNLAISIPRFNRFLRDAIDTAIAPSRS